MESFSQEIIEFFKVIPPALQMLALAFFSFAEGLPVIGTILPGGTIAIFAGSLSANGIISPVLTCIVIGMSSFFGDMTGFLLGKKLKNWGPLKKITESEKHVKSWDLFDKHIALISIFGKMIPVVRSTPSLFAAARGIKTRRYMIYSFIGSMLWGIVGIYAGNFFTQFFGNKAILFIFGILIASILFIIISRVIKVFLKKVK